MSVIAAARAAATEATAESTGPSIEQRLEEARAAGEAAGRTAGRLEGAAAERDRILGIQAAAFPGQEALAAEMIADGSTTAAAAALRFISDLKAKGPDHVAALRAADANVRVPANATAAGGGQPERRTYSQDRDGWLQEWKDTPALQAEFVTAEDYAATRKAEADGRVRSAPKKAAA